MPLSRRRFLHRSAAALPLLAATPRARPDARHEAVLPPRLRPGDVVGLVSPAGALFDPLAVAKVQKTLGALGLRTRLGAHALDRRGYLAGTDADRAADLHAMFADPDVRAVVALRGGWGAARILPLLDYDLFRRHPKILLGYSDITSLLIALYARSGLVTFHGPVGISSWNPFTLGYLRPLLFDGEMLVFANPQRLGGLLTFGEHRIHTITPGTAEGRLVGGNLSVLTSMMGSSYLPDFQDHILFLEDTGEEVYRVDRMLAQLKLAGVLDRITGFVFGKCSDCDPEDEAESLTLFEVFADYLGPLGIPAWYGAMIGHISDKFTVPLGVRARIDAAAGTVQLLEPAVR